MMKTGRRGERRRTARGDTETMAIVRGGEGTVRGAAHEIETITDTEIARGHATGAETATESAIDAGTVHEAASTDDETIVLNPGEHASQTRGARHHAHAQETATGATTQGADHHTRQKGDETERARSCLACHYQLPVK